jgi:hypothetical protein
VEKIVGWKTNSSLEEGGKDHDLICFWRGNVFAFSLLPLK